MRGHLAGFRNAREGKHRTNENTKPAHDTTYRSWQIRRDTLKDTYYEIRAGEQATGVFVAGRRVGFRNRNTNASAGNDTA